MKKNVFINLIIFQCTGLPDKKDRCVNLKRRHVTRYHLTITLRVLFKR